MHSRRLLYNDSHVSMRLLPSLAIRLRAARTRNPSRLRTFQPNLTVHCICAECNHFFGRTLEWPMRNLSAEGVLRLQCGIATTGQIGNIGTIVSECKVAEAADLILVGVLLKPNKKGHLCEH